MLSFFKDALQELKHVVWPTKKETNTYFTVTVGIMVSLGVFLFIVGQVLYAGIFAAKDTFGVRISTTVSTANQKAASGLDKLKTSAVASGNVLNLSSGSQANTGAASDTVTKAQLMDTLKKLNLSK